MKKAETIEELEKKYPESARLSKIIADIEDKAEDIAHKADLTRRLHPKP